MDPPTLLDPSTLKPDEGESGEVVPTRPDAATPLLEPTDRMDLVPETEVKAPTDRPAEAALRRTNYIRSRFDLVFDFVLLVAFVIAYSFNFTGLSLHEWFGLAFGLALLVHLTLHWDWVVRTTRRVLSTSGRRRVMWAVNFLVLVDLTLCVVSGIAISAVAIPALGFHTANGSGYWTELHKRTADAAIVLIAIHVGLDWRWIVNVTRRLVGLTDRSSHLDDSP